MFKMHLLCSALVAGMFVVPVPARAYPDGRLEVQDRVCWETLPDPAMTFRCPPRSKPETHPPRPGGQTGNVVNCERAHAGDVSRALKALKPGAVLTLVVQTRPCVDSLVIEKPVTLVVESRTGFNGRVPSLTPPANQPCARVLPTAGQVTFRNVFWAAEHAQGADCIASSAVDLTFEGGFIRYDGEGSAVRLDGGRLAMSETVIAARSRHAAIRASGVVEMERTVVLAAVDGLDLRASGDVRIRGAGFHRLDDWTGTQRAKGALGLALRSDGGDRLIQVEDATIDGFSRGVYAQGEQEVALMGVTIRDSDWGVISEGSRLRLNGSEVEAAEIGLYAAAGEAFADGDRFFRVRRAGFYVEHGAAQLRVRDNLVFAEEGGCQALTTEADGTAVSCRPWFEAPEFYRTGRRGERLRFEDAWPDQRASWSGRGARAN